MTHIDAEFPCPGDCNRRFRETEAAAVDGDHDEPFTPGQPIWCPTCRDLIERDLGDLWSLALDLNPGKLNTPREVNTGNSARQRRSASPSGSPGWDAADELIRWAINLEDTTRIRLGHGHPNLGRRMLADSLRYLQAWTTAVLSDTDTGQSVGEQIRRHKRALTRATGNDRLTHRLKGQCPRPRCGARGRLARADGTEIVKCGACGAMWSWDYFQHLARAIVDTERSCAS